MKEERTVDNKKEGTRGEKENKLKREEARERDSNSNSRRKREK